MGSRVAIVVLLAACSRTPAPKDPTERALFRDLERQVTVAAATGWGVDKLEIEGLLETALDSVCRVDVLGRRGLRTWLADNLYVHGAELPAEALIERITGRTLDVEPFFRRIERRVAELE